MEGGESRCVEEAVALGGVKVVLARKEGEGIDGARCRRIELGDDRAAVSDHGRGLGTWDGLYWRQASELLVASGRARVGAIHAGNVGGRGAGRGCGGTRGRW